MTTEKLYLELHKSIEGYVRKRVKDASVAKDIVQDIFLKAHTKLPELRDDSKITPWLYRIARNTVIDHYRNDPAFSDLDEETIEENSTDDQEILNCLHTLIDALPSQYKEHLYLSDVKGIKQSKVAERLGLSASGARSRVQRARKMVREKFDACCVHFVCGEEHKARVGEPKLACPACDS